MKSASFCIVAPRAERFFALTSAERSRRSLSRRGIEQECDWQSVAANPGQVMFLRGDYVLDDTLIGALARRPGAALAENGAEGRVVIVHSAGLSDRRSAMALIEGDMPQSSADIALVRPVDLAREGVDSGLRKRFNPLILKISDFAVAEIEERLFGASYKGVTDFVTKRVWPWPALRATRWCVRQGITPNQVTMMSAVLVVAAFGLFWVGAFVPGLIAAWAMCFLDTVDGKLARVTLSATRWGDVFDHGIDLVHPPFWYWAWCMGLGTSGVGLEWALWTIVGGYVLGRLQEGWFLWRFKFEIHSWQRIDSRFREVTARRNPNLALLSVAAIVGEPGAGFFMVAIWTLASLAFHFARIAQAEVAARQGRRPASWLSPATQAAET